jgi:hypothetical protein
MAKIQTYQQRQGLPTRTGVQLQVTPAQSNVGTSLFELGTQFGQIGDRLDLAQDNRDISTSTLNATVKLQDLEMELSTADPRIARSSYQGRADQIFQEAAGGLSGRVLDKFTQNFNQLSAKSRFAIKSASVTRHRQQLEGGLDTTLAGLVRAAGNNQLLPTRGGKQIAQADIIKTGEDDIDAMVAEGVIKPDVAARRKLKFRKKVAGAGISSRLRKASLEELGKLVVEMGTDKIKDPEIANYWSQLNETEKLAFQKKVLSTHEIQLNIIDKQEIKTVAGLKRKYDRNFAKRMSEILLSRQDADKKAPTRLDLTQDLEDGLIDGDGYNKLDAMIQNPGPSESNSAFIDGLLTNIRDAKNEDDLKAVITKAQGGLKNNITLADFRVIEQRALTAKVNTPEAKRQASYGKALDKVLASTDFLDQVLPGVKERAAFVKMDFEARVADGEDPAEAFTTALEAFRTRGTVLVNSLARPQFGPAKKLNEWTLDDVETARERTKKEFKGKANTLGTQLLILNSLSAYLGAKKKAISNAKSGDPKAGTLTKRLEDLRNPDR